MWLNDVTLEGLSKSVKHTKYPSALAYDEVNIHVKGWVIMKRKCVKVNEWGDNMIEANVKDEINLKWAKVNNTKSYSSMRVKS